MSSGVWSTLEGVWFLEEAVRKPLLGLYDQKVLGERGVLERGNVMSAWPSIMKVSKAVGSELVL